ncbi:MAG: glycosyltransferase family 2 protein [Candidatus Andersenbacteria bacterium]|nr:glycosyltransferase family 2 protein [Candidatus Andersenbacteria bacterium]
MNTSKSGLTLAVFMPNYNHARFLPRAIEAIASQSRQPDDFLIIDDGSRDASVRVIQEYQKKFPFIRLIAYQKNRGLMYIMGTILEHLACDYLFGSAADDYILPGFFQNLMKAAAQYPQAGILFAPMVIENEYGNRAGVARPEGLKRQAYLPPQAYLEHFLHHEPPMNSYSASTAYRTAALEAVGGFRPALGPWCDTFALRAAALRFGACYLEPPAAVWTQHRTSVSHTARKNPHNMLRYIKRAAQLMRSREFAPYFPQAYVARWQAGYAASLYGGFLLSWLPLPAAFKDWVVRRGIKLLKHVF